MDAINGEEVLLQQYNPKHELCKAWIKGVPTQWRVGYVHHIRHRALETNTAPATLVENRGLYYPVNEPSGPSRLCNYERVTRSGLKNLLASTACLATDISGLMGGAGWSRNR